MTETATIPYSEVIPLKQLRESPTNPRRMFDAAALEELAESIRRHGVLQPLLVRPVGNGAFEIVAGARRFRAAKMTALVDVRCTVQELDDKQVLEVQFVENLQRADLHPLDEGIGYRTLHQDHGYSVEDLAAKLGKSKAYVYSRMKLADLPVKVQTMFVDGKFEASHALLLARIPDEKLAVEAANAIAHGGQMSYRSAVDFVERNYRCRLREAVFSTSSKDLIPEVGPCGPCPKRTGNQQDLFGGADSSSADVCTDPKCFQAKERAHWDLQKRKVVDAGGEVFEGKKAKELRYSSTLVDPEQTCHQDPKGRKWKQLLKGAEPKDVLLLTGDEGALRWSAKDARAALKQKGHEFAKTVERESKLGSSGLEKWQRDSQLRDLALQKAIPLLVQKACGLRAEVAWRLIIKIGFCDLVCRDAAVSRRRGFELMTPWSKETAKAIEQMTAAQLQGLAIEVLADEDVGGNPKQLMEELGIDEKSLIAEAKAEQKAKAKAEKDLAKAVAKAEKAVTKPEKAKTKPKKKTKAKG